MQSDASDGNIPQLQLSALAGLIARPRQLAAACSTLGADAWASLASAPDARLPYGRRILHADARCEIMLARWAERATCAPHDHGTASGAVVVLAGMFLETRYRWHGDTLAVHEELEYATGAVICVGPDLIHSMGPKVDGLTLHIYVPALPARGADVMRVFDRERAEVLTVDEAAGAWLPQPPERVRSRLSFARVRAQQEDT